MVLLLFKMLADEPITLKKPFLTNRKYKEPDYITIVNSI